MKNKVEESLEILEVAAQISKDYYGFPLIIAYSGGKDSDVMLHLALKANIEFEVLYSTTTVDAPQTMKHIRHIFKRLNDMGIKTHRTKPTYKGDPINMFSLIEKKGIPPTRLVRYCCDVLKEASTPNRVTAVGVRESESRTREGRAEFNIGKRKNSKHFNVKHVKEVFDSAKVQDPIWDCLIVANARARKEMIVNPIYHWSNSEIWTYIKENDIPYNELYDMGYSRVGCILCPMAKKSEKKRDEINFPWMKQNYIKAFDRMLKARKENGKDDCTGLWVDGRGVYRWWIGDDTIPGQLKFNDDGEIEEEP